MKEPVDRGRGPSRTPVAALLDVETNSRFANEETSGSRPAGSAAPARLLPDEKT
jgi:hypothetical protein